MTTFKELVSLQFSYDNFAFEKNFKKLSSLVKKAPTNSIICAPELCLSNFCYDNMFKAADFSTKIEKELLKLTKNKTLCLSMVEYENGNFYNRAKFIQNEKIIYQRDKYELFKLGKEDSYFTPGKKNDIKIFKANGIKYAILICFELRFVELWKQIQGADIILIPSLWATARKKHLQILSNALSLLNQCFVIVSNSANEDMAKNSSFSSPFGEFCKNDRKSLILKEINLKEIKKMRRYIDIGIK